MCEKLKNFIAGVIQIAHKHYKIEVVWTASLLARTRIINKVLLVEISFIKLSSGGQQWFDQRKLLTPAFHFEILQHFVVIFDEHCKALVDYINKRAKEGFIDIRLPITLATLDIICGKNA